MDGEMIYSKTVSEKYGDVLLTREAHVIEVFEKVYGKEDKSLGYVATRSVITNFTLFSECDTKVQSFFYDNKKEAIAFCEEYFDGKKGE